ncbi:MAG: hypothetical protein IIW40_01970 [Clostridia bacterium]|nr:hypothetical protein [Clostridia bacterium]
MFEFEANEAVIVEQQKALEAALTSNPRTEKVLRDIIRKFILEARQEVVQGITFKHGDPRGSAQAVRTSVYKKVFGANINILTGRKRHGESTYRPPRTLKPGQRGGNRRPRNPNKTNRDKYDALDRGFILRWMNSGVSDRAIEFKADEAREHVHRGSQGGNLDKYGKTINTGRRGSIAPRNFFRPLGDRALGTMRDNLTTAIEEELAKLLPHDK